MMLNCSDELVTEVLNEAVAQTSEALQRLPTSLLEATNVRQLLPQIYALSPYLQSTCCRYPELLINLIQSGALNPDEQSDSPTPKLDPNDPDSTTFEQRLQSLRLFRHQQMVRIIWRDLANMNSVDETLQDLSDLADECIQVASIWAHQIVEAHFGLALDPAGEAQQLIVLGMGKLGGQELNVSSDIDLIYLYPSAGHSNGARRVDTDEYFRHVAIQLTQLLSNITSDGFVFRVDTRLRPFGDSGPLVMHFDRFEQYLLTQGRDWERYAMIKARPIVGQTNAVEYLNGLLQPFVYRRYLDYSAIDELRQLKRKIALSVKQKSLVNNVKLGIGGIREVEFIGQAFQLVRGGRHEPLQVRSIKQVLRCLESMDLMSASDVQCLLDAYDFLRKVENAVQCMRDQQTHAVPTERHDQLRLLGILKIATWGEFETELSIHRANVSERFNTLFSDWDTDISGEQAATHASENANVIWAVLSSPESAKDAIHEAIASAGVQVNDELLDGLISLSQGGFYQRLTARSQSRVDAIMPLLIDLSLQEPQPESTLIRCLGLVRAVAGRSGYLQILIERPTALARLVKLFARSSWVVTFVTQHPIVIDELLRDQSNSPMPDKQDTLNEAMALASRLRDAELDEQMDAMRQFKHARELRIAAAQLTENLPLMKVSDQLTWLAEAIVLAVVQLIEAPLIARHGNPSCEDDAGLKQLPQFGIVAYGKLGGLELGYGSDLDLVFLHNSFGKKQETNGDKPVENGYFYSRLAQKFVHFMTTLTPAGVLYEIDLRLRPNGQSGVLVTSFSAYDQYQREQAWTWEHQAMVRARIILGSDAIVQTFNTIRFKVLKQARDTGELQMNVRDMRLKMRENLSHGDAQHMHLKNDAGGIADIEFMVQYIVLACAAEYPELLAFPDNIRILEAASNTGLVNADECAMLKRNYLLMRDLIHRQALQQREALVEIDEAVTIGRNEVIALWQRLMES